jgi:hypothetical protein
LIIDYTVLYKSSSFTTPLERTIEVRDAKAKGRELGVNFFLILKDDVHSRKEETTVICLATCSTIRTTHTKTIAIENEQGLVNKTSRRRERELNS